MKIKLGILLLSSILLMTSCNNAQEKISSLPDEDTLPSYEQLTIENEQLIAENKRLKELLYDNGIYDKAERHPLDVEFENVTSDPEVRSNSSTIKHTFILFGDKWKDEMEKHLELLTDKLDDDKVKCVAESQAKWEELINADDELKIQSYIQVHGNGSIISEFMALNYYYQYRTRALYLKSMYETIKDTVKNRQPLG